MELVTYAACSRRITSHFAQHLLLIEQADINHPAGAVRHQFLAQQEQVEHAAVSPGCGLELTAPAPQAHSMQPILCDVDLLQGWQLEQQLAPLGVHLHARVVAHVQPLQVGGCC